MAQSLVQTVIRRRGVDLPWSSSSAGSTVFVSQPDPEQWACISRPYSYPNCICIPCPRSVESRLYVHIQQIASAAQICYSIAAGEQ